MPITAAKGQINLCLEPLSNQGLQPLLVNASPSSSMSLTTQPVTSAVQGARLVVWVMNAPQAGNGTFTLTGLDINGNPVSEGPITIPAPNVRAQSAVVGKFEYCTTKIFASVNSNGLTTTNLSGTGATITVQGAQAGKYLVPGILKTKKQLKKFSPKEHRNLLDMHTNRVQTRNECTLEELSQVLYPENSEYAPLMICSSVPVVTTLPGTPTSLKTATAVAGGAFSLTTQPLAPGQLLIFTVTGSSAPGSIAISGTNQYNNPASETVTCSGNGTFYASNVYSAVASSGITPTGLTSGSVAVGGVYGFKKVYTPSDIVYSASTEAYTGVDSYICPWTMLDEFSVDFAMDKEAALSSKGIIQDRLLIGPRGNSFVPTNLITALGQPGDIPMAGWQSLVYFDSTSGAAPTTTYADLISGKLNFKSPQKPNWTATNSQNYNRVNRGQRESTIDVKIDFTNVLEWEKFRTNLLQYITFQLLGQPIVGGNNKTWQWTYATSWDDFDIQSTPDMEHVEGTLTTTPQYDSGLGGSYIWTTINQFPPIITA